MDHPPRTYDAFLSYNSRDHAAVERIGRRLRDDGLTCFMDRWYLIPGTSWQSALEQAVAGSKAIIVLLGPGEMGRWQQRERDLALDRQANAGVPVIPVLLPGSDPALGFLSLVTWVDLRDGLDDEPSLKILAGAIRGQPPADLGLDTPPAVVNVCPFRGLLPYREEDSAFFFGRDDDTNQLVKAVGLHRIVPVVGPSGTGKSSVVQAGLVPRLRADADTAWEFATMVPTDRPLHSLVYALAPLVWPDVEDDVDRREKANEKAASFEKGTLSLRDLVEIALAKQPGTKRLLLVVDQWEELYTLCRDDATIRRFIGQLFDATRSTPLTVVFTCRADFYGRVLEYRPLVERIDEGAQVSLGPMNETELRQVIDAPAAKVGLEFEPGLVDRILGDMGQGPGRLPLLSFLLEQLWNRRKGATLTNDAFDAMGGVEGAIATVAEELFEKRLTEAEKLRLPRLFIQLVSVGEESEDTRRRATLATLGDEAQSLIKKLTEARLLVTDSAQGVETAEVAHEALIRHWKRSQAWVDNARGFLTWRKRLEPFVKECSQDGKALLRGGLLVEAQRWLAERPQDLDAAEREFIEASTRQQEHERDAERRRVRTLTRLSVVAFVAAATAAVGAATALWQKGVAYEYAKTAKDAEGKALSNERLAKTNEKTAQDNEVKALRNLSASLAAQSAAVRADFPQRSVLLAVEATNVYRRNSLAPVVAAEQSLRDSLRKVGGIGLPGHEGPINSLAIGGDGRWLVAAGYGKLGGLWDRRTVGGDGRPHYTPINGKLARLWDLHADRPERASRILKGHEADIDATAIGGGGRWLATRSRDGDARLWDLQAERPEQSARVLEGPKKGFVLSMPMTMSGDGRWLVTASDGHTARLWDLNAERPEESARVLAGDKGAVAALVMSGDGRWLVTGSYDRTVRFWDLKAERPEDSRKILEDPEHAGYVVAIGGDGRWLVTRTFNSETSLWDLKAERPEQSRRRLIGHQGVQGAPDCVAIGGDGRWLVTAGADRTARVWDLKAEHPDQSARVLEGHQGPIYAVAVSRDGRRLVTAGRDNTARLWDLDAEQPEQTVRVLHGNEDAIMALALSGDGRRLVAGSYDGSARVWDLQSRRPEESARVFDVAEPLVLHGAVGGDGRWLATAGVVGDASLWDLDAERPEKTRRLLKASGGGFSTMATSLDGRWLAARGHDGIVLVWDLNAERPEEPARKIDSITRGLDAPTIAFSGDGRRLVTVSVDGTATLWDLKADRPEGSARVLKGHKNRVDALAMDGDGRWLATASVDGAVLLWDLKADRPEQSGRILNNGNDRRFGSQAMTFGGRRLAVVGVDRIVRLWDLKADRPEEVTWGLKGEQGDVQLMAIDGRGRWLVTASQDKPAWLWDLQAERPEQSARVLKGHRDGVSRLVIDGRGRWLVTASTDKAARLWDLHAERPEESARVLRDLEGQPSVVAFSGDGRRLVTVSVDGTARSWELTLDELREKAERAVGRNLTRQEWNEIFPGEPYRKTFERLPNPPDDQAPSP